ncbi:MAG: hypothetical protein LBT35_03770, partial [Tannerella sp.]|nr:hypothetical protein [Tannerella sp.]
MKVIPSLPLRPVFTPVENFGDQTQQFGRQVSIGLLPDFPRSDISPRRNDDVTRRSGNVTRRSGNVILCYKDSIDTNSKNKRYEAKKSFAAKLYSIENGISGVQNNPEIQGLMSLYGYTPERVAEGQVKLANVKQLTALNAAE